MNRRTLERSFDRLEREHDKALRELAAQVRVQYVIPNCLRAGVSFRLDKHTLDYWLEAPDGYALLDDKMARAYGIRTLRWCFDALATPAARWPGQNEARVREDRGGVPVLAMFMRNYTPPSLRHRPKTDNSLKPSLSQVIAGRAPVRDTRPGIDDDGRGAFDIAASHRAMDRC